MSGLAVCQTWLKSDFATLDQIFISYQYSEQAGLASNRGLKGKERKGV